jgi:phospholipid/cholesterol/gamma-HCH transport system ATP-binding protein
VAVLGHGRLLGLGTMEELARSDDPLVRDYFHGPRGRAARVTHLETTVP